MAVFVINAAFPSLLSLHTLLVLVDVVMLENFIFKFGWFASDFNDAGSVSPSEVCIFLWESLKMSSSFPSLRGLFFSVFPSYLSSFHGRKLQGCT